jgi:ribonuclease G
MVYGLSNLPIAYCQQTKSRIKIYSMNKELIIRSSSEAVDFALLKDGKLIELHKERESSKFQVGDIFIAKIRKPVAGLNAAFVNVGFEKDAFLHYHDLVQISS